LRQDGNITSAADSIIKEKVETIVVFFILASLEAQLHSK